MGTPGAQGGPQLVSTVRAGGRGGGGRTVGHGPPPTAGMRAADLRVPQGPSSGTGVPVLPEHPGEMHSPRQEGQWLPGAGEGGDDSVTGGGALGGKGNVLEADRGGGSTTPPMC